MIGQSLEFNPLEYGDNFFADLEAYFNPEALQQEAQAALTGILIIQRADGRQKTYQEIQLETERFFANPLIIQIDAQSNILAMQLAQFCQAHGEGGVQIAEGLSVVYDRGVESFKAGHHHEGHDGSRKEGTDEKKKKRRTFWEILATKQSSFMERLLLKA